MVPSGGLIPWTSALKAYEHALSHILLLTRPTFVFAGLFSARRTALAIVSAACGPSSSKQFKGIDWTVMLR
jgi:hypothetical protein